MELVSRQAGFLMQSIFSSSVVFSPDGEALASVSIGRRVKVWMSKDVNVYTR